MATGFAFAIPLGYEVQVRPRSGLALKHGITCLNTPGTIDSDYRGEVKVILANLGDEEFLIERGDRIAQLVVAPVTHAAMVEVDAWTIPRAGPAALDPPGFENNRSPELVEGHFSAVAPSRETPFDRLRATV